MLFIVQRRPRASDSARTSKGLHRQGEYDEEDEKTDETAGAGAETPGQEVVVEDAESESVSEAEDDVLAVSIAVPQMASADFAQAMKALETKPISE